MEEESIDLSEPEAIDEDWNSPPDDKLEDQGETREEETAPAQAGTADSAGSDQSFTLKHLGEVRTVGRDEVITLAQKGLDYDRIRGKYDAFVQTDAATLKRQEEIHEFLGEYGVGIDPRSIPREVWQSVTGGKTLLAAYQAWELKKLRAESGALRKNTENKERSAGSRFSAAGVKPRDAIADDWYDG
jgi:hypothetical protein